MKIDFKKIRSRIINREIDKVFVDNLLEELTDLQLPVKIRLDNILADLRSLENEYRRGTLLPNYRLSKLNKIRSELFWQLFQIEEYNGENHYKPTFLSKTKGLRFSNIDFVGREKELSDIADKLKKSPRPLVISGAGGMGKSTLSYAYINYFSYRYKWIIWVKYNDNLENDFIREIEPNFYKSENLEENYAFEAIHEEIKTLKEPSLLVIDDIENNEHQVEWLKKFTESLNGNWSVLFTSRVKNSNYIDYELSAMTEEEGLLLFTENTKRQEAKVVIKEFLTMVQYHPICIELCAKTLEKRPTLSLENLMEQIKNYGLTGVKDKPNIETLHNSNKKAVMPDYLLGLFDVTFYLLSGFEKDILALLAFLPNGLNNERILKDLANPLKIDENDLLNTRDELMKVGLIKMLEDGSYSILPITKEVINKKIPCPPFYQQKVIEYVAHQTSIDFGKQGISEKVFWSPILEAIIEKANPQKEPIITLLINLSVLHRVLGKNEAAKSNYKRAKKIILKNPNLDLEGTKMSMINQNLSIIYLNLGNLSKSIKCAKKVIKYLRNKKDIDKTIIAFRALGNGYYRDDKLDLAEKWYKKAVKLSKQTKSKYIRGVAMNDYGSFLSSKVRTIVNTTKNNTNQEEVNKLFKKAEHLLLGSLACYNAHYGTDNHDYAPHSRVNLGVLYSSFSRYEKAEHLLKLAKDALKDKYGELNLGLLITEMYYVETLLKKGAAQTALTEITNLKDRAKQVYTKKRIGDLVNVYKLLAEAYQANGHTQLAINAYKDATEILQRKKAKNKTAIDVIQNKIDTLQEAKVSN